MFWSKETEIKFFKDALINGSIPEQLFYFIEDKFYAYAPKGKTTEGETLQSRNTLIGSYTEDWTKNLLSPIAENLGLHCVKNVVCSGIGLTHASTADIAFCKTYTKNQLPENIALIFEVKMSIVNNYVFIPNQNKITFESDFKGHKGRPSLLRSDSMLKAIGKSINIRVSGDGSTKIPIVIIGNSPISKSYVDKVDFLRKSGVIQSFISVYPNPIEGQYLIETPENGFVTYSNYNALKQHITSLINSNLNYFASMIPKDGLGGLIEIASQEKTKFKKAEKFLELLKKV